MDVVKNRKLIKTSNFTTEIKIYRFKELPVHNMGKTTNGFDGKDIHLSILGNGTLPQNRNYVTVRIPRLDEEREKAWHIIVVCICIAHILDVKGEKKFHRTIEFQFIKEKYERFLRNSPPIVEERYVERKSILNNELEYLKEDTLTILIEVTLMEWADLNEVEEFRNNILSNFVAYNCSFEMRDVLKKGLEVYLLKDSALAFNLQSHSAVFRDMWDAPMLESAEKRVLLMNEELPAFLCMLVSLESMDLILHEVSVFDLYKMADKYDVPILIETCRKYIEKYLPRNVLNILEFARFYDDKYLQQTAKHYLERQQQEDNVNEGEGSSDDDVVCDTSPVCNNLIQSKWDFIKYLRNLKKNWKSFGPLSSLEDIAEVFVTQDVTEPESFDFYS